MNNNYLWKIYSIFYDSLLRFLPYNKLLNDILDEAKVGDDEKVLDLGSGTGNLEKLSLDRGEKASFCCVDNSSEMLSISKKKCENIILSKYDINNPKLPFNAGQFSKILSVNVIYNVEDIDTLFKEINRILIKNGYFVFSTSVKQGIRPVIVEHLKMMNFKYLFISILYIPVWLFVILINVFIDRKYKHYFYSENTLINSLESNGFKVISNHKCYGGLNRLIKAKK